MEKRLGETRTKRAAKSLVKFNSLSFLHRFPHPDSLYLGLFSGRLEAGQRLQRCLESFRRVRLAVVQSAIVRLKIERVVCVRERERPGIEERQQSLRPPSFDTKTFYDRERERLHLFSIGNPKV